MSQFKYTDFFEPKDISIAKCWSVISSQLFKGLPVNETQRAEMEKAFYIGFTESFKIMVDLAETLTEEQAAAVLDRINQEAADFHKENIDAFLGRSR